jgi:hypothetical protein
LEDKFEVLDKQGEPIGSLYLNIKYAASKALQGTAPPLVAELVNTGHKKSKASMTSLLQKVYERMSVLEESAKENKELVIAMVKDTCGEIIIGRKNLKVRAPISMAKRILRESLGREKGDEFIAECFGPNGDSEDSELGKALYRSW